MLSKSWFQRLEGGAVAFAGVFEKGPTHHKSRGPHVSILRPGKPRTSTVEFVFLSEVEGPAVALVVASHSANSPGNSVPHLCAFLLAQGWETTKARTAAQLLASLRSNRVRKPKK